MLVSFEVASDDISIPLKSFCEVIESAGCGVPGAVVVVLVDVVEAGAVTDETCDGVELGVGGGAGNASGRTCFNFLIIVGSCSLAIV